MQSRDIGNEILVAIGAVGVIALALVFGTLVTLPNLSRQNASAPATQTHTPMATPQGVASMTDAPASTPTATPLPTNTVTATASPTPDPTATATPSPSATRTPTATRTTTRTVTSSPAPTLTATPAATATPAPCSQPEGWVTYTVRSGDTLFTIARSVGSTVAELSRVNCLANADRIITGDRLFVPRLPPASPRNPAGGDSPPGMGRYGCTEPAIATITHPRAGATVSGTVIVNGTASLPQGFGFYKLEVRPDAATIHNFWSSADAPVVAGQLGMLDTQVFGTGLHWLRLVVVAEDGSTPPGTICTIPLFFR